MFKKTFSQRKAFIIAIVSGVFLAVATLCYVIYLMPPSPRIMEKEIPLPKQ